MYARPHTLASEPMRAVVESVVTKEHTLRTEGTGHGACGWRGACSG